MIFVRTLLLCLLTSIAVSVSAQSKIDSLKEELITAKNTNRFTIHRALFDEYLHSYPDSADFFLERGFGEIKNKKVQDSAYYQLLKGNLYSATGQLAKSKPYFKRSIALFRQGPDTSLLLKPLKNLGVIMYYEGNIDTAIFLQSAAFDYYLAVENWKECAYTKNNIGVFYKNQGKFQLAIQSYQSAAVYFEKIGLEEGMATVFNNIGSLYVEMDRPEVAKTYFTKSLNTAVDSKSKQDFGRLYLNLGIVSKDLGDFDVSMQNLEKALPLFLDAKDSVQLAHCYNELGVNHLERNKTESALNFFKKAVEVSKLVGDTKGEAHYTNHMARGLFIAGDLRLASQVLNANLDLAKEIGSVTNVAMAHDVFSMVLEKKGDYQNAYYHYKRNAEISDSLKSIQVNLRTDELATLMELNKKEKVIASQKNELARQEEVYQRRTIWFYFVTAVVLLLLVATIVHLRYLNARKSKFVLKSQIDIIKNQLSPHFLYNSLNLISSLIKEDKEKAEETVFSLSKIYQYTLDCFEEDLILLEDELKLVNEYRKLLDDRFEHMVRLEVEIEGADQIAVVPMSLQLLIENAIKHNSFSVDSPLKISVVSDEKSITVRNNTNEKQGEVISTGKGISLLNDRYKLLTNTEILVEQESESYQVKLPLLKMAY
ncbi:MAG: tetratricopeptide repeat protein [Cyclobacteriaceae bacterium]